MPENKNMQDTEPIMVHCPYVSRDLCDERHGNVRNELLANRIEVRDVGAKLDKVQWLIIFTMAAIIGDMIVGVASKLIK